MIYRFPFGQQLTKVEQTDRAPKKVFVLGDQKTPTRVTSSFGVVKYNYQEAPELLINRADKALYQSKGAGRNQVTVDQGEVSPV